MKKLLILTILCCLITNSFADEIYGWGRNHYGQAAPPEGNDFTAIAAGYNHSLALKKNNNTPVNKPFYKLIDLGTLGGNSSSASSINNSGQIVGNSRNSEKRIRATLFDSTGAGNNIDLGTLGGNNSYAKSINDNGQIVGSAYKSSGLATATMFDPTGSGNNIDLGTLTNGSWSEAVSINNNGQIVGGADNATSSLRAILFDPTGDGNNIDLGFLPDGSSGEAVSINNNGQIVGASDNATLSLRATLFDPTGDGNNIDLGARDDSDSIAWSINDSGQIVGEAFSYRATLFDPTGDVNNINLGTLPNFDKSCASSINNSGQIVGCAYTLIGDGESRATFFDSTGNGNNIDLNTLIDPNTGWTLEWAASINDNGWIVGSGKNPDGNTRAFLLIPINTAPVAVAGPNQTFYICSDDELADVTLDGSGSYDDDNDLLDYYWSWIIDGNVCEANGVSPTIQLPIGEHEIELVVDDGLDYSEPNSCIITVVPPLHAKLMCMPNFINTQSQRGIITAVIYMPAEILPGDINLTEPLLFMPGQVESLRQFALRIPSRHRPGTVVMTCFNKDKCLDYLSGGLNRIKVTGRLTSGQCYCGESFIYVFKPIRFRYPWLKY